MKGFGEGNSMSGNGNVVVFALGVLLKSRKNTLADLALGFSVFKTNVLIGGIFAAPFLIDFSKPLLCLRVVQTFGNANVYFRKAFVKLNWGFDYSGYNIARLLGAA